MGGGGSSGGGGQTLYFRNPSKEWPTIENWYGKQQDQFHDFIANDPIWSRLQGAALDYFNKGPSDILKELQGQGLDYLKQGPSAVTQALSRLGLGAATAGPSEISQIMQGQAQEDLLGRGALTPALNRDVRNETLATAGAMGMGFTPGTLGTELLNRERYREQREQLAHQYAGQAEQASQADLASRLQAGQVGQGAELADVASRFGIASGVQGQTLQDIAQRFAIPQQVATGETQAFGSLTNPILSYLNSAFTPTTVGQAAGDNKGGQLIGAGGTIVGAAIPVIAAAV